MVAAQIKEEHMILFGGLEWPDRPLGEPAQLPTVGRASEAPWWRRGALTFYQAHVDPRWISQYPAYAAALGVAHLVVDQLVYWPTQMSERIEHAFDPLLETADGRPGPLFTAAADNRV